MEVEHDLSALFETNLVRCDHQMLKRFNVRRFPAISQMIDKMGRLSSEAQQMRRRILTSFDKLIDAEDHVLYIMWQRSTVRQNQSLLLGLLKVARKQLYLYDTQIQSRHMNPKNLECRKTTPVCILDFYIHFSIQRQGLGHKLFDFMLQSEGVTGAEVAIDKPSDSLLQFMQKHYNLTDPVWQNTNYVVYPQFFQLLDTASHVTPTVVQSAPPTVGDHPMSNNNVLASYSDYESHSGLATPTTPSRRGSGGLANEARPSTGSAQMAKQRKVASMGHQMIW